MRPTKARVPEEAKVSSRRWKRKKAGEKQHPASPASDPCHGRLRFAAEQKEELDPSEETGSSEQE